jgi:hypothetical protein
MAGVASLARKGLGASRLGNGGVASLARKGLGASRLGNGGHRFAGPEGPRRFAPWEGHHGRLE